VAGELWCWGATFDEGMTSVTPHQMAVPASVASVALADEHACILTSAGDAYCLGYNNRGQLGTGEAGDYQSTLVRVTGALRFTSLSTGWDTS
jgi:alpha-tubulin suppressor-like RCC1 family protein